MTHGFPVPTVDRDEVVNDSLKWLKDQSVWSRGRFGAFKYEVGNADHCFIQVITKKYKNQKFHIFFFFITFI